ncbi:helix-turn-helix transcriptional regulator [Streptomyces sp. Act143]|uniref:helix-turn-helix domain-containing protein n=1 Tax=Streptomyces sp. Act143 TaxID=2200760 RepID=UPI0015E7F621|nr:helix-turn-helix transcriptional regulator [Streptomyces sp. Act143]
MLRLDTELLKARAAEKGDLTHEEIARRAGIDRSVVTRVFNGSVPTLPNVTAIAWAYGIALDELVPKAEDAVGVPA